MTDEVQQNVKLVGVRVEEIYEVDVQGGEGFLEDMHRYLERVFEDSGLKLNGLELRESGTRVESRFPREVKCYHITWPERSHMWCDVKW